MKRKLLFVFFSILFLGHAVNVNATEVTATVTADNYYVLFYGNEDGSTLTRVGSSLIKEWRYTNTYTFDVDENDHIYAAVWGDGAVSQGFIGQFVTESGMILTHPATWEACSMGKPFSIETVSADISSANWSPINYSAWNGEQWEILPSISLDALWIWPTPLRPGSSLGEYHLLRTKAQYYPIPVPAIVNAGEDLFINIDDIESTTIYGMVTYTGDDPLQYRWVYGRINLLDWKTVGENNECLLALSGQPLPSGPHKLTLQVTDGQFRSSDSMILTIDASQYPVVDAGEDVLIYNDEQRSTTLLGMATYEGENPLQYRWTIGEYVLLDWTPVGTNDECFLFGIDEAILPGTYELTLEVTDGEFSSSDSMMLSIEDSKTRPPVADAGEDVFIYYHEQGSTTVLGMAIYEGENPLQYRWILNGLAEDIVLLDWTPVGANNECFLTGSDGAMPPGRYQLSLEVRDGQYAVGDSMMLTITYPSPIADAGEDVFIYYDEQGSTTLLGMVTYEGDKPLQYRWTLGPYILLDWTPVGANNECFITGQDGAIPPGVYELTLEVTDGQQTSSDQMIITIDASPPPAPVADAGENISIYSEDVTGIIYGTATYTGDNPLQYRWLWEETILLDWTPAGPNNECILVADSTTIPPGTYILTLEVSDGQSTSSDSMILTILNSAPHAAILGGAGTYQLGSDVVLSSEASDFDGDTLTFSWKKGSAVISTGNVQSVAGGTPVLLPDCTVSGLDLGTHYLTLEVSDGVNDTVIIDIIVEVVDTQVPTLAPILSTGILWPPNHQMVDITIQANAFDNSGLPVTLSASVISSEPLEGLGDGDMFPDWTDLEIDQDIGIISLQLRAERSGTGDGREYTVIITATDISGNSSSVEKIIIVPHDKSKK